MKTQPITSKGRLDLHDWEAISAYLDGALNPQQKAQLEARLEKDAEMRAALQEMRRTRTVLRSQPRLRAPRNFTLTAEMAGLKAGRRSQPFAFPILRLASVLATIFFVVVAVGDLVGRSAKPALVAQAPSAPVVGMGGGGAGGPGFGGGGAEVQMKEAVASEETPAMDSSAAVTTTLTAPAEATATAAAPERNVAPSEQTPEESVQTSAKPVWSVLRALQVLLALLAVSAGVGAWVIRRQARR